MTVAGARARLAAALAGLPGRSRSGAGLGYSRVRAVFPLALQAGVAAGLAWFIAYDVLDRQSPFFAPTAAVVTLASSAGKRARRMGELVVGVAVGIGVGDALILLIGSGGWQIALVVVLAIVVPTAVGAAAPLVVQSASSAVLVVTLATLPGQPFSRFFDALIGGAVGLTVMTLLPLNPVKVVRRAAEPALEELAEGLRAIAEGLRVGQTDPVREALDRLRAAERDFTAFDQAASAASENVAFAPARWRSRSRLNRYLEGADEVTYALRNVRVLARRVLTGLDDEEPTPESLAASMLLLADAVDLLRAEWRKGVEPVATRERALRAVAESGRAYDEGVGFSGGVVVAQIRTTVSDLLRATGVEYEEAPRLVRRAFGRHGRAHAARKHPGLPGPGWISRP
ncbi:aromatic acid exporter family protein [Actinoplanes sp. NPDC049668]|uniref:FUSC family protein n=1 Tax=unclassified Actinoplanes TaxID=2626549 RepID=UPI0033ADBAEA